MRLMQSSPKRRRKRLLTTEQWIQRVSLGVVMTLSWGWIVVVLVLIFVYNPLQRHSGNSYPDTATGHQSVDVVAQELPVIFPQNPSKRRTSQQQKTQSQAKKTQLSGLLQRYESPLLIFTCARAEYLQQTLEDIYQYIDDDCIMGCPIIISQDGNHTEVNHVIQDFANKFQSRHIPLIHLQHEQPLRHTPAGQHSLLRQRQPLLNPYQALAIHYGWALRKVFSGKAYTKESQFQQEHPALPQRVIILEEDLHIAPDFFSYFAHTAPLLDDEAQHLFAVSAFNDNGFSVKDETRILRSDFFPGLGWMMPRWLWDSELESKWPEGYWDDWLREPAQRQDRHVLRPEISRTFHFGSKGGASANQFGNHLSKVQLNQVPVDWSRQDLGYLRFDRYDTEYRALVQAARPVSISAAREECKTQNVRVEYKSLRQFQNMARDLQIMTDEKAGILRTAYKGIVEVRPHQQFLLFLTPSSTIGR